MKIKMFDSASYAHECQSAFMESKGEQWAHAAAKAPLVFFDDFLKFKVTERTEAELFALFDRRMSWELPTIITTNATGATMKERLSPDRAEPLLRRLKENFQEVYFP